MNKPLPQQNDSTLAAQVMRILQEQHVPWGAQTYARDLRRRLEEVLEAEAALGKAA